MKVDWNKKYTTIAIYAFLVIASSIIVYLMASQAEDLKVKLSGMIATMQPFIIGAAISDIHPTYVPLFFSRFNYIITDWGTNSLKSINAIVRLFIIALCIYCCGYIYSEHKEFIEKGHK